MIAGKARKNPDTGRMEVDLLKVDEIEIMWLHEALNNYTNVDDDSRKLQARLNMQKSIDDAFNKVRP